MLVRDGGFEPLASAVQVRRSNRAEPIPVMLIPGDKERLKRYALYPTELSRHGSGSGTRTHDLDIQNVVPTGIRQGVIFGSGNKGSVKR